LEEEKGEGMKISELQKLLRSIKRANGDVEIRYSPFRFMLNIDNLGAFPEEWLEEGPSFPDVPVDLSLPIDGVVPVDGIDNGPWCLVSQVNGFVTADHEGYHHSPREFRDSTTNKHMDPLSEQPRYATILDPWIQPCNYEDEAIKAIETGGWFSQVDEAEETED
jgi:hypothetical protein